MLNSKAYWILPDGNIIDIGLQTHIEFIIQNPVMFNTTRDKIISLYEKYGEMIPVEGNARRIIIMDLLDQEYIRIRQYKNHWSISVNKMDDITRLTLSKWAELAERIANTGKYADVIIQTIDGSKHECSVKDLIRRK